MAKKPTKKAAKAAPVTDVPAEEIGAAVVKEMKVTEPQEVKPAPVEVVAEVPALPEIVKALAKREVKAESPLFPFLERDVKVEAEDVVQLNAFSGESVTLCLTSLRNGFAMSKLVGWINGRVPAVEVAELFESVIMEVKKEEV